MLFVVVVVGVIIVHLKLHHLVFVIITFYTTCTSFIFHILVLYKETFFFVGGALKKENCILALLHTSGQEGNL